MSWTVPISQFGGVIALVMVKVKIKTCLFFNRNFFFSLWSFGHFDNLCIIIYRTAPDRAVSAQPRGQWALVQGIKIGRHDWEALKD